MNYLEQIADCDKSFCHMCGAVRGDYWETHPSRRVILLVRPRVGDGLQLWTICDECHVGLHGMHRKVSGKAAATLRFASLSMPGTVRLTMGHIIDKSKGGTDDRSNLRAICTNCNEGLSNIAPQKPSQIALLSTIRRATIEDQKVVLEWLTKKFKKR